MLIRSDGPHYPVCSLPSLLDGEFSRGEGMLLVECFTTRASVHVTSGRSLITTIFYKLEIEQTKLSVIGYLYNFLYINFTLP